MLIRVAAAGVNNTDVNTRVGWYGEIAAEQSAETAGDWTGEGLQFPRIQGADVCGTVVRVGSGVSPDLLTKRVIVQSCLLSLATGTFTPFLGSERDGAFAQFVTAPALDTFPVTSTLSDAQLAAVPCAYGTAENLLHRCGVVAGERVLITGASGNVGVALIQLAKRRGAHVTAVSSADKQPAIESLGADRCLLGRGSVLESSGTNAFDVVIDVVGGPQWPELLEVLKPRGRYGCSGAIAGPVVSLDLRKLYLKDLTFFGCTSQEPGLFQNIVSYLERGEIEPVVSQSFALGDIAAAQTEFLTKRQVGKIVLIPPQS